MKVLFICIENTCRSQMAEGFARHLGMEVESAGMKAGSGVNTDAIAAMAEVGIDIAGQSSKVIDYDQLDKFDAIISMCSARTTDICPSTFVGVQANWNIEDPKGQPPEVFRQVRDVIKTKVEWLKAQSTRITSIA